jgi:hypothetical protein
MSKNCIRCCVNDRTGSDLWCDSCREIMHLRTLLASAYAGATLYADDGELQDNSRHPLIDFKRDTPEEISLKMRERGVAQLASPPQASEPL